jgi:hypothetical protein
VSPRNGDVERILKRLQALCRRPPSDERAVHSGRVPEDLATESVGSVALHRDEEELYQAALQAMSDDLRFEHMDERDAQDKLWRFVCQSVIDRSHDHVRSFVATNGREVMSLTCYLPVEHLTNAERAGDPGRAAVALDE